MVIWTRRHIKQGADWIKIHATGSIPTRAGELAAGANATAEDPQRLLERTRARALLDELLDTLDDDKRQVFVLYEIEELPMREVIEIVGCPLQTGYSRLHAARKQLKQAAKRRGLSR